MTRIMPQHKGNVMYRAELVTAESLAAELYLIHPQQGNRNSRSLSRDDVEQQTVELQVTLIKPPSPTLPAKRPSLRNLFSNVASPATAHRKDEWSEKAIEALETFAASQPDLIETKPAALIDQFVQTHVLKTTPIPERIQEAVLNKPRYRYLEELIDQNTHPKALLKAVRRLPKKKRETFWGIVGGKPVRACLKECSNEETLHHWEECVQRAQRIREAAQSMKILMQFPLHFDTNKPIANIPAKDITESFRRFYNSSGETLLRINRQEYPTPDLREVPVPQRPLRLMAWLITTLNRAMRIPDTPDASPERQAALLCDETADLALCRKQIPSLGILQALSINAYSHADRYLRLNYPFFDPNPTLLHLKTYPCSPISYDIQIRRSGFRVSHHKQYAVITGHSNNITLFGKLDLTWALTGRLGATLYMGTLCLENIVFPTNQSTLISYEILQKLGLLT